jgi:hypothetical protein
LQSPPLQFIEHDVVFVHVCMQSPPGQSAIVQTPPVHSWMQSPDPVQVVEHDAAPLHVWWQSLVQLCEHVAPAAHEYWQSPFEHVSVHEAPAAHAHTPASHAKPVEGPVEPGPVEPVVELPPHAARAQHTDRAAITPLRLRIRWWYPHSPGPGTERAPECASANRHSYWPNHPCVVQGVVCAGEIVALPPIFVIAGAELIRMRPTAPPPAPWLLLPASAP